jgi:hypothetical protein
MSEPDTPTQEEKIMQGIIAGLLSRGINFLALDFDQTIVSLHTGGRWQRSVEELQQFIRPLFRMLIPMAIKEGMMVAIVTFSPQLVVIEALMNLTFRDIASQIVLRGIYLFIVPFLSFYLSFYCKVRSVQVRPHEVRPPQLSQKGSSP